MRRLLGTAALADVTQATTARTNIGLGSAATQASTAFMQAANNLSELASAATARTNLGLKAVAASGSASDLTTGTLAVLNGGTGVVAWTAGDLVYAPTTNTLGRLPAGTNGYVMTMSGGVPTWAAPVTGGGSVTSISMSGGSTGLSISPATISTNGTFTLGGALNVASGGTGNTFLSGYVRGNGTSPFSTLSAIPASDISGTVANASHASTADSATFATSAGSTSSCNTATNLSGGSSNSSTSSSGSYTVSGGIFGFGGQSTGTYGSSGSTVGWEISGTPIFSCSFTSIQAGSTVGSATCYFGTSWTNVSDARTKKNILDYALGLDAITQLQPRTFQYNGEFGTPDDGRTRVGFVAQELQETALVNMVSADPRNPDLFVVNTNDLIFTLVNAVKELAVEVASLKAKVA